MQLPSRDDLFNYYQAASSKVKQYVRNITPLEQKVMDATSNEKWGPHGTVMAGVLPSQEVTSWKFCLYIQPLLFLTECVSLLFALITILCRNHSEPIQPR